MSEALYELHEPDHPWGDYGQILFHGMSLHLARHTGRIQLERTAPFVPPISFPGFDDVIWTDDARTAFLSEGFTGADFRKVRKTRIVRLHWERWDRSSAEPQEYPHEGEPEGYILDRAHDPELANAIGDIWELVPTPVPGLRKRGGRIQPEKHPGLDVCVATDYGMRVIVSNRVADWLRARYPEWVTIRKVRGTVLPNSELQLTRPTQRFVSASPPSSRDSARDKPPRSGIPARPASATPRPRPVLAAELHVR